VDERIVPGRRERLEWKIRRVENRTKVLKTRLAVLAAAAE
jgi:hypothetical protein